MINLLTYVNIKLGLVRVIVTVRLVVVADPSINEGMFTVNRSHFVHSGFTFAINSTQFVNYVS